MNMGYVGSELELFKNAHNWKRYFSGKISNHIRGDVLEHIEEDSKEVINSYNLLKDGGELIVLSPSYQYLFSPFDSSVGHFRRYDKSTISSQKVRGTF